MAISVLLRIESALRFCFLSLVQALLLASVLLLPEASQAFHLSLELLLLLVRVALLLQLHSLLERELALLLGTGSVAAAAARLATYPKGREPAALGRLRRRRTVDLSVALGPRDQFLVVVLAATAGGFVRGARAGARLARRSICCRTRAPTVLWWGQVPASRLCGALLVDPHATIAFLRRSSARS